MTYFLMQGLFLKKFNKFKQSGLKPENWDWMEGTKVFVLKGDRNVKVVYRTIDDCVTNESCS